MVKSVIYLKCLLLVLFSLWFLVLEVLVYNFNPPELYLPFSCASHDTVVTVCLVLMDKI